MSKKELQQKEQDAITKESQVIDEVQEIQKRAELVKGMSNGHTTTTLFEQLYTVFGQEINIINIFEDIKAIAPQDHVEKMLTVQMITTHNMLMKCFTRSTKLLEKGTAQCINLGHDALKLADKLTRTYAMQMETLSRYRNKGKQKMTVEHVHVNAGGQAIIGHVATTKK